MDERKSDPFMPLAHIVLSAGVTSAFHPVAYAKVLIQLGYEPLSPVATTSFISRRKMLVYPSIFKYVGHIKKTDGFLGLYRGVGARLVGGTIGSMVTNAVSQQLSSRCANEEVDEDHEVLEGFKRVCHDTTHEMVSRCAGVVVSQPFHVIMVRSMAQFVGGETQYNGIFSSISEIYNRDGILGFFVGLAPRLLGEAITIWLANILVYVLTNHLIPKDQVSAFKTYASAVCTMMVSHVTYPFSLVCNVMAVNDSGLAAGRLPHMPRYDGWMDCFNQLRAENQLKRGSSLLRRAYLGPVTWRYDGQPVPALQQWSS